MGALMHKATSPVSNLRLAIAPGVPSSHLSALLALQRAEEPEVTIAFFEVTSDTLIAGLREDRYDAGLLLQGLSDPTLKSQRLWIENMAVALPLQFPSLSQATLTIAELLDYPLFRWRAEACPLLDERLSSFMPTDEPCIQCVTSFEMMAIWVAAGYGIGVCAQSRVQQANALGIEMRPLSDGPYEIVTHLLRPSAQASSAAEQFERRALQIARAGAA